MLGLFRTQARERLEADFEGLRLRIARAASERGAQIVSIAGMVSGAGVTTLTTWMAGVFAREGRTVLLVEANRTTPRLHRVFGIPRSPGATEVLAGKVDVAAAIHRIDGRSLSVIGCGVLAEHLAPYTTERWRSLLSLVHDDGTLVLVDAGPTQVPGTLAVSAATDATVLVVEAGRTRWEAVAATVARLEAQGASLLGVALSKRRYPIPELLYRGL
jgi:Mrp family chromosome partitioning ATPase